jgi:pSer/pThr/pTyr-binding forkhead associated (FHA) protein
MNAQILYRARGGAVLTFDVREGEAVVGREPGLAVAVPVEGVSRQHARITWDGASYWIEDLKSTNGTFVNGLDLSREGRERLRHLDVITLGRGVELLFLVRDVAPAAVTREGIVSATLIPEDGEATPYDIGVGEITLGRTPSNNVVVDSSAVSKQHAKIQRTMDRIVIQDLSSSNGTFVNGARVMTALLQDGDRVSLASVASYRVKVVVGEVTSLPGAPVPVAERPVLTPEYQAEWKTIYEWDSGEYAGVEAVRRSVEKQMERERTSKVPPGLGKAPLRPAPGPPRPEAPPTPILGMKPAAPAVPRPPTPAAVPRPPAPAPATPHKPPAPAAPAKAAPPAAAAPAPAPAPAPPRVVRIGRVILTAPDGALTPVTEPGTYVLGRISDAPLRVVHATVSRKQANITLAADRASVRVEPLGSSPTLVNGAVIGEPADLKDGDRLQVGDVVLAVRFET